MGFDYTEEFTEQLCSCCKIYITFEDYMDTGMCPECFDEDDVDEIEEDWDGV